MKKHLKKIKLKKDVLDYQSGYNSEMMIKRYAIMSEDMNNLMLEKLLAFFHVNQ
jgi:hypothetical protein